MKQNPIKKNLWRYVLQFAVLISIILAAFKINWKGEAADIEAYCPFGGLQAFGTFIKSSTLACSMSMLQIMMGIALGVTVMLLGKLFCGYLCPMGTITEWIGRGGRALNINFSIRQNSTADYILRLFKYLLLGLVFWLTLESSELFCRRFDPFYAVGSGFKGEIIPWMAYTALGVFLLGNLFIRQFWCKYICPLGAMSNIFRFALTFIGMALVAWGLTLLNILPKAIVWQWFIPVTALVCYLWEILFKRSRFTPVLYIQRNENACTHCGLCQKKCPMGIDPSRDHINRHIDCTLCGECISACNLKALSVNGKPKMRWLPAIATVVLFALALFLGNKWELPTINEKWSDTPTEELSVYRMENLRTVKCYGSSKAFSAKMKKVAGVHGVATYVRHHNVDILYDPKVTSIEKIQEAIFTPSKMRLIDQLPQSFSHLKAITFGVEGMYDRMDFSYLGLLFREIRDKGIYGISSEFACPVKVTLYLDPALSFTKKELENIVETKVLRLPKADNKFTEIPCKYRFVNVYEELEHNISRSEFADLMFTKNAMRFKGSYAKHGGEEAPMEYYDITYPGMAKPAVTRNLPYLGSFLSRNEGFVGYETLLVNEIPTLRLIFVKGMFSAEKIWELLQSPVWIIHYSDGSVKEEQPRLLFENKGILHE